MGRYTIHIVGEANYQPAIIRNNPGDPVSILYEPDNKHDPRAMRVASEIGETLGYLERGSWLTRAILDDGTGTVARIYKIVGGEPGKPSRGIVLEVLTAADASEGFVSKVPAASGKADKAGYGCITLSIIGFTLGPGMVAILASWLQS